MLLAPDWDQQRIRMFEILGQAELLLRRDVAVFEYHIACLNILLNLGITQILLRILDEFGRAAVVFPPGQGVPKLPDLLVKSIYRLRVLARGC